MEYILRGGTYRWVGEEHLASPAGLPRWFSSLHGYRFQEVVACLTPFFSHVLKQRDVVHILYKYSSAPFELDNLPARRSGAGKGHGR